MQLPTSTSYLCLGCDTPLPIAIACKLNLITIITMEQSTCDYVRVLKCKGLVTRDTAESLYYKKYKTSFLSFDRVHRSSAKTRKEK